MSLPPACQSGSVLDGGLVDAGEELDEGEATIMLAGGLGTSGNLPDGGGWRVIWRKAPSPGDAERS
jgi:hypothetical protein